MDPLEVAGHLVERVHQHANFIIAGIGNTIIPISVRHLMSSLGKLLNRHRDSLGKIDAKPGSGKNNHERDQQQGQDITVLDRLLEKFEVLVFLVRTRDLKRPLADAFGNKVVDHDNAENFAIPAVDRYAAANNIGVAEGLRPRYFQSAQNPLEKIRLRLDRDPSGYLIIERDHDQFPAGRKNFHGSEVVFALLRLNKGLEIVASPRVVESLFGNALAELARVEQSVVRRVEVIGLADFERPLKRVLDLDVEPAIKGARNEPSRDGKHNQTRDQRQPKKSEHQTDAQTRTQNAPFSFKRQFHQVADDQKDQQQEKNNVEIDEQEEGNVIGQRGVGGHLRQAHLENSKNEHHEDGDQNHQPLALAPLEFR